MNRYIHTAILAPLVLVFVRIAYASMFFLPRTDHIFYLYRGFLITEHGFVPYRDFFSGDMPGVFFAYSIIWSIAGSSSVAGMALNVAYLSAILVVTFFWMRAFGTRTAIFAVLLYGLMYLEIDSSIYLQREFLGLLFISAALIFAIRVSPVSYTWQAIGIGAAFGAAAFFKPYLPIGYPVIFAYTVFSILGGTETPKELLRKAGIILLYNALGGITITLLWMGYLQFTGTLSSFIYSIINIWPSWATAGTNSDGFFNYIMSYISRFDPPDLLFLIPAVAGVALVSFRFRGETGRQRNTALMVAGLAVSYALMAALNAVICHYHWIIYVYFLCMAAALCYSDFISLRWKTWVPALLVLACLAITLNGRGQWVYQQLILHPGGDYDQGTRLYHRRANIMTEDLRRVLQEGDHVEPLCRMDGTLLAMLHTRAIPVTPARLKDTHFYLYPQTDYILNVRREYLEHLERTRPEIIIDSYERKPYFSGPDGPVTFDELYELIGRNYTEVVRNEEDQYVIYRLKPEPASSHQRQSE